MSSLAAKAALPAFHTWPDDPKEILSQTLRRRVCQNLDKGRTYACYLCPTLRPYRSRRPSYS